MKLLTMRHILFAILGMGFGALIKGIFIGAIGGLILGLSIAEITCMIDAMRK